MSIINNYYLKKFIIFLLVIVILINFNIKPHADAFVITGIAIKVFTTVLASMGILAFVNSQGGVSNFFNEFKDWYYETKEKIDISITFYQAFSKLLMQKTKMKLSSIATSIREFYNIKFAKPDVDLPEGVEIEWNGYPFSIHGKSFVEIRSSGYPIISKKYIVGNFGTIGDYSIVPYVDSEGSVFVGFMIVYNGQVIKNLYAANYFNDYYDKFDIDMNVLYGNGSFYLSYNITNRTKNKNYTGVKSLPFEFYNQDLPDVYWDNVPVPVSIPYGGLSMPWDIDLEGITGYIGRHIEDLIEDIANIPISKYIESVLEYPIPYIDSLPAPIIDLDEDGRIRDVEIPDIPYVPDIDIDIPDLVPELKTQTGILSSILDFLKDIFKIPDDISLDFEPLKNLIPHNKFPFSLPWDFYNIISQFSGSASPPEFNIKILGNDLFIDFSQFNSLASLTRNFLSVIYVVGLIFATKRLMGGGS